MTDQPRTASLSGLPFTKMTGSGNDFVFFDGRSVPLELVTSPEAIRRICNRHNGIGADGVVVLEPATESADVVVHYFNSDGTPADLCGNATLCSTSLAAELGIAARGLAEFGHMRLTTGAGLISSRISHDRGVSLPEIDFQPVTDIRADVPIELVSGESRIGFATAGIPHLIVLCDDAEQVEVAGRGPALRWHAYLGRGGANVNWVSRLPDGRWRYRTFERGVEGETLACGTGAVATAILVVTWGLAEPGSVPIVSSSGRELVVRLRPLQPGIPTETAGFLPTLQGEGRVVFHGVIRSL